MNLRNRWDRVVKSEGRLKWLTLTEIHRQRNALVQTRQVLRAQARRDAMTLVNDIAGGEPRKNRRRMALAMARREWRPAAA
jgi:hypothetical protein